MNKKMLSVLVVAVIAVAVSFYGGIQYGKKQSANVSLASGQTGAGRARGTGGAGGQRGFAAGQGFINGSVISASGNSLVLKLRDGGSRIVLFASSTAVSKQATGSITDVVMGSEVMVIGDTNADGSVTAKNIQLRPATSTRPF